MAKKKSSILINTLVLVIISVVAVAALAVVNQFTKGPIEEADINAKAQAYLAVYPEAEKFAEIDGIDEMLDASAALLSDNGFDGLTIVEALAVQNANGENEGYVISSISPNGYGGALQIAIGIKDGKLTGFVPVLANMNETPGFGAKCVETDFTEQFAGKAASILTFTKTGATSDTEIDAISGATITTKAVTQAVNAAIVFYQENFGGGVQEIEIPEVPVDQAIFDKCFEGAKLDSAEKLDATDYKEDNFYVDSTYKVENGYVIVASATNGYCGNTLTVALGIGNDGEVKGFNTIVCDGVEYNQPYGTVSTTDEFAAMFKGLKAEEVKTVDGGAKVENNEIDAISGATFSTTAVKTVVNGAINYYNAELKGE